jgi:Ni/Co efflux regulator RcnB
MKYRLFCSIAALSIVLPTAAIAGESPTPHAGFASMVDLQFLAPTALSGAAHGAKPMTGHMPRPNMGHMPRPNMGHMPKPNMGHMPKPHMGGKPPMMYPGMGMQGHHGRWGPRIKGRWHGGVHAPGGYGGYHRPFFGYILPRYWIQPSFYIGNYSTYGFARPQPGYGWSRYYDDAVLTDRYGRVHNSVSNVDWDRYEQGYRDGYSAGQASIDRQVLINDDSLSVPQGDYNSSGSYQGHWDGAYLADGSYQGQWNGTYEDANGQRYQGQYQGTFQGNANVRPVKPDAGYPPSVPYDDRYESGYDDDMAYLERCRQSSGIGGAVVGGAIGALAGNRIAGRGDRTAGTLIGGGLGAIAGAAIDINTDKCRKLMKQYQHGHGSGGYPQPGPAPHAVPVPAPNHGWQGGYYPQQGYYYPQPTVTTIVIQPGTTTTTTTTVEEEVFYETVAAKKTWKPAKKWAPKPKPRCSCK